MDETPKKKTKKRMRNLAIDLATLLVIGVIAVFAIVLLGQREGGSSTGGGSVQITGIHCSRSDTDNPFIGKYTLESGTHEVRANFKGDNLTNIMYSFSGIYKPGTDLNQARTVLHANFDLAYGNAAVHRDGIWSESFSVSEEDREVRMSIYSEAGSVKSSTAEVFMLPTNESFPKTLSTLESAYKNAGFSCQVLD